jgi:tetratricopeptide (TPR) repeat protein
MAKKMTTISLSRKKELDQPDEVSTLLSRAFAYCIENKKMLLTGLAGVMILAMMVSGYRYYLGRSEEKASAMLADALNQYGAIAETKGPQEALKQVRDAFASIESEFGGTKAGGFARMHAAGIYYDAGEYQEAAGIYGAILKDMKETHPLRGLALIGMGYAQETLGDNAAAIRYLEEALSMPSSSMKGDILFHLGRLYAAQGQAEKSKDAYRRIVTENMDSLYLDMARNLAGI